MERRQIIAWEAFYLSLYVLGSTFLFMFFKQKLTLAKIALTLLVYLGTGMIFLVSFEEIMLSIFYVVILIIQLLVFQKTNPIIELAKFCLGFVIPLVLYYSGSVFSYIIPWFLIYGFWTIKKMLLRTRRNVLDDPDFLQETR
jgi:hypothetical protein